MKASLENTATMSGPGYFWNGSLFAITELCQPPHELLVAVEVEEGHYPLVHTVRGRHRDAAQDVADGSSKRRRVTRSALLLSGGTLLGLGGRRQHA